MSWNKRHKNVWSHRVKTTFRKPFTHSRCSYQLFDCSKGGCKRRGGIAVLFLRTDNRKYLSSVFKYQYSMSWVSCPSLSESSGGLTRLKLFPKPRRTQMWPLIHFCLILIYLQYSSNFTWQVSKQMITWNHTNKLAHTYSDTSSSNL